MVEIARKTCATVMHKKMDDESSSGLSFHLLADHVDNQERQDNERRHDVTAEQGVDCVVDRKEAVIAWIGEIRQVDH